MRRDFVKAGAMINALDLFPHTTLFYIVLYDTLVLMKEINIEETKAGMRRGMLEYCILLIISRGKMYASDMLGKLKDADLIVVEGTIYPLLNRLRNDGLLDYTWEESKSGPPRKYYTLTQKGRDNLSQLKTTWKSLVESIETLM